MAQTANLEITTLETDQQDKVPTINEGFHKIDAILNSSVIDKDLSTPPGSPSQGDLYIVGSSPTGDWSSQANKLAYYYGGWKFITPNEGMIIWVADENMPYFYNGSAWQIHGFVGETSGEYWRPFRREVTVSSLSGATGTASALIKDRELVFAIHSRVTTAITGASSFTVGDGTTADKFGSGIGIALDSTNIGVGTPTPYFSDTDVIITATGSNFTAGAVKLVLHGMQFKGPWNW